MCIRDSNYLVKQNADKFYDEAVLMASTYEDGGYYYSDVYDDTQNDTRLVASFLNARIWIVDPDGRIYLDSQNGSLNDRSIPGFDSAENASVYQIGHYYNIFSDDMLSVMAPINHNYETIG